MVINMTAIEKFQKELKSGEAALIQSSVNRRYLTSFLSSDGFLLVTSELAELYLDSRYFEMAEKAKQRGEIPESVELKKTGVYARALELLTGKADAVLLYENKRLYCSELEALEKRLPGIRLAPLGDRLEALRAVKTEPDLDHIYFSATRRSLPCFVLPSVFVILNFPFPRTERMSPSSSDASGL